MEVDFVTYQIAVKLKEKGFKEKCIAHYWEKINEHTPCFIVIDDMKTDGICIIDLLSEHNKAKWSPFIDAPTITQALKWLREEKRIDAGAVWTNNDKVWVGYINEMDMPDLVSDYVLPHNSYDSYECAVISVIEYILDNNLI